jgi:hypothetical protein
VKKNCGVAIGKLLSMVEVDVKKMLSKSL